MDTQIIVVGSVLGAAWLALLVVAVVLCTQVRSLRKKVAEMQATGRMRIQYVWSSLPLVSEEVFLHQLTYLVYFTSVSFKWKIG